MRLLEIYQEFGFIVLVVFVCFFTYLTDNSKGFCIATQIVILFFINFVSSIFVVMSFLSTWQVINCLNF